MPIRNAEGGCLCGAIRYRVNGTCVSTSLCHCRSCRLVSGAPSVAWVVFRLGDFAFVKGQPARFRSSPPVARTFCGQCGTPLTYQRDSWPDTIDVTTVTLDHADEFAPTKEIWVAEKLPWETLNDDLPHFLGSSVSAASKGD
jgi:hypothetical protein